MCLKERMERKGEKGGGRGEIAEVGDG